MALWTAQYRYSGDDRYDITAKANNIFSPPWRLVSAYKNAEARASLMDKVKAEEMVSAAKLLYRDDYLRLLVDGISGNPLWVGGLLDHLSKHDLTMVCFCNVKKTGFCHRLIVAEYLFNTYDIQYNGERSL